MNERSEERVYMNREGRWVPSFLPIQAEWREKLVAEAGLLPVFVS